MKSAGEAIRERRTKLKMSLDELGRLSKVERSKLSRFERGYLELTPEEMKRVNKELKASEKSS